MHRRDIGMLTSLSSVEFQYFIPHGKSAHLQQFMLVWMVLKDDKCHAKLAAVGMRLDETLSFSTSLDIMLSR